MSYRDGRSKPADTSQNNRHYWKMCLWFAILCRDHTRNTMNTLPCCMGGVSRAKLARAQLKLSTKVIAQISVDCRRQPCLQEESRESWIDSILTMPMMQGYNLSASSNEESPVLGLLPLSTKSIGWVSNCWNSTVGWRQLHRNVGLDLNLAKEI